MYEPVGTALAAVEQGALQDGQRLVGGRGGLAVGRRRLRSRVGAALEVAVKARALTRVARGTRRIDQGDERVAVAVVADLAHALHVARGLALVPDLARERL